jgi:hypothetical protein
MRCFSRTCGVIALTLVVGLGGFPWTTTSSDAADVVAVVAVDSYRDLKKQLTWLGREMGNPMLAGSAEGMLMMATGGQGLAGLDVRQPLGVIITSDNGIISGCGCVPAKDVDALLGSLQGVIGPVQNQGGVRQLTLPGIGSADIVEKDGWALISPTGMPVADDLDPSAAFETLADDFTVAVSLFPSVLPEPLRQQFAAMATQAAAQTPGANTPQAGDAVAAMVDGLGQIESLTLGIGINEEKGRVEIENRTVAVPGAPGAVDADETASLSVPLAETSEPMMRMMLAQTVTPEMRQQVELGLAQAAEQNTDPQAEPVIELLTTILGVMLDSGRLDATLAVTADGDKTELTGGASVADGRKLESAIKQAVEGVELPPGVALAFDVESKGDATLHTLELDPSAAGEGAGGSPVKVTLAITPSHVYALAGGDVSGRLDSMMQGSSQQRQVRPGMAIQIACEQLLDFIATTGPDAADIAPAAEAAKAAPSAMLQFVVRPIDRGMAWQLTADGGVLRAAAAMTGVMGGGPAGGDFGPPGGGFGPPPGLPPGF